MVAALPITLLLSSFFLFGNSSLFRAQTSGSTSCQNVDGFRAYVATCANGVKLSGTSGCMGQAAWEKVIQDNCTMNGSTVSEWAVADPCSEQVCTYSPPPACPDTSNMKNNICKGNWTSSIGADGCEVVKCTGDSSDGTAPVSAPAPTCQSPEELQRQWDGCKSKGGSPTSYLDGSGCKRVECPMAPTSCMPQTEFDRLWKECEAKEGKASQYMEGNCPMVRCEIPGGSSPHCMTEEEMRKVCEGAGGVVGYNEHDGCKWPECAEKKKEYGKGEGKYGKGKFKDADWKKWYKDGEDEGRCKKEPGFSGTYVQCYDGYEPVKALGKEGKCMTPSMWEEFGRRSCEGHCYADKSKCGVNSYSLGQSCGDVCPWDEGGGGAAGGGGDDGKDLCPVEKCGPQLGMPNWLCEDGKTFGGPTGRCLRHPGDQCGWEVLDCPKAGPKPTCPSVDELVQKCKDEGKFYRVFFDAKCPRVECKDLPGQGRCSYIEERNARITAQCEKRGGKLLEGLDGNQCPWLTCELRHSPRCKVSISRNGEQRCKTKTCEGKDPVTTCHTIVRKKCSRLQWLDESHRCALFSCPGKGEVKKCQP